ncbi:MAG: hypothetical protein FJ398_18830 [Verrucomicrobia bacterium]|nr:hypothetical protein [Verrucomicrobiota bacterium]
MSSPNQEFTKLEKLLACKRYEQPPPGYFDNLRDKVMSRLEAEDMVEYSSWWHWLIEKFDARPVLVCAYGVAISGLLLGGFRLSQVFESEVAATSIFSSPWLAVTPGSSSAYLEDFEQSTAPEAIFTSVTSFSKRSLPVFGVDHNSPLLNDASGLRFTPVNPSVSPR